MGEEGLSERSEGSGKGGERSPCGLEGASYFAHCHLEAVR